MGTSVKSLWDHPVLPIFDEVKKVLTPKQSSKLILIPTLDIQSGEEIESDCLPVPSPLSDLPEINTWVRKYVIAVVEIWNSKRPAMQLARWSHRKVYRQLVSPSPITEGCKIRKIYINEPFDGVVEATITLHLPNRIRSLALRFEGVDKRWLCTELILL